MQHISFFLSKVEKLLGENQDKYRQISETISKISGVELNQNQIKIQEDRINISCSGIERSCLLENKEEIESALKKKIR